MNYNEVLEKARGNIGPYCKACPVCNGKACGNTMPGPGSKNPGNGAARNFDAWQKVYVNMDTINSHDVPTTDFTMFGHTFGLPIFTAPIGALPMHYSDAYDDFAYNDILIPTAVECGGMSFTGDGVDPEIMKRAVAAMNKVGGVGVPTIKPWNVEAVMAKLDILNENNIFAAAMDIDGAGLPFLKAMNPNAGSKTVEELREIISYAKMPFIIKGIMTPRAAEKAVEAGAAGIVVSNHGGRVLGQTRATAGVLPDIARAVKGKCVILVDGGIRSGVDVFKAIALGADAVLIGRPFVPAVYGGEAEGAKLLFDKYKAELIDTMTMCGAHSLAEISPDMVYVEK
ncbi:MAG TPA: alpha-hydroxy-acid oxidizing protein [Candidatus Scatomorpha merdigallinarum]|nr:alpha-hydroxy-acid oxidizing protein [Candidatus Scatomorpha merdigallinarum]